MVLRGLQASCQNLLWLLCSKADQNSITSIPGLSSWRALGSTECNRPIWDLSVQRSKCNYLRSDHALLSFNASVGSKMQRADHWHKCVRNFCLSARGFFVYYSSVKERGIRACAWWDAWSVIEFSARRSTRTKSGLFKTTKMQPRYLWFLQRWAPSISFAVRCFLLGGLPTSPAACGHLSQRTNYFKVNLCTREDCSVLF